MGFIQGFQGALGGMLSDSWKDFLTVPENVSPTAALFPAVKQEQNAGRGSNTDSSTGIITNGSKIVVPEGYGLLTFQDGAVTGFIAEAGGYVWQSDDPMSESFFSGGGIFSSTLKNSWERFKFGGQPGSQQQALFVSLKELPNNRFGTQSEIYWDDAYLNAQVGAVTRGAYTLRIVDPILFAKAFVPASYLNGRTVFDFTDMDNPVADQLFQEVIGSLAPAFSLYTNDPAKGNRMAKLQSDSLGFAQALSATVDEAYGWRTDRGLAIVKTTIVAIEYDADTRELLSKVKRADALSGSRGNSNLQASVAQGFESAGEQAGGPGLIGLGMAASTVGVGGLQQPAEPVGNVATPPPAAPAASPAAPQESDADKLRRFKGLLEEGLISQEDFDAAKAKILGL